MLKSTVILVYLIQTAKAYITGANGIMKFYYFETYLISVC